MKVSAFYIAEQLDLRRLKETYAGHLLHENPSEVFFRVDGSGYFYAFDYGAVVFADISDVEISQNLAFLQPYCQFPLKEKIRDDFEIMQDANSPLNAGFDSMTVPRLDETVLKITMLTLAHSVSLDFYAQKADSLLSEVNHFTTQMERSGTINISRKNMVRFIGRTLNSQNRIVDNLFIFDSPESVWEDEYLDRIHRNLARTFEIQSRFKETEYTFKAIDNNLAVFRELYFHRESSQLEWIIIALICIEVFDMIISKFNLL
ncbi:MAG: RMD1 family protein [Saprospiraceae bacterium]|nr:RMD1 family protein [Saprospiraceae bacterium]